ncbi:MAG: universal stress protein [Phycisphaerae bacterium]
MSTTTFHPGIDSITESLLLQLADTPPHTILVAIDATDDLLLGVAAALAQQFHATLLLVHAIDTLTLSVYTTPYCGSLENADHLRAEARSVLTSAAAKLPTDVHAETLFSEGTPSDEIVAAAEARRPDLVLLGKHHHSLLYRIFVQSTANAALHKLNCPVALIADDAPPKLFHCPNHPPPRPTAV